MFTKIFLSLALAIMPVMGHQLIAARASYEEPTLSPDDKMLFILHAQDGHLQKDAGKNRYILTLYKVSKKVTFFTDRPARKAGVLSMEEFLRDFREEKPNAGLVSSMGSPQKGRANFSDIPVTLSEPQYDKSHDRLIIYVELMGSEKSIYTGDIGATTLFIDDFGPYPGR